jgi:flagellar motor protein MotB
MTITIAEVVREVGGALFRGEGAYFAGSGISYPSGLPDWIGLIKQLAASLGITITDEDDLPSIAQYCVNADLGNRGAIVGRLKRILSVKDTNFNPYHDTIARTNLTTLWTTNYDTLFEKALAPSRVAVRANDSDLTSGTNDFDIELIKIHGCINRSAPDEFVLTKEDYEDFEVLRPAMGRRLRHDLLNRTLLLIGYGYRDPNIMTAVVEARRLTGGATREHFLITGLPKQHEGQAVARYDESVRRQNLWLADLRRFGIRSAVIENYDDLTKTLSDIALVSRGQSVFVTGSHKLNSKNREIASRLGAMLASIKGVVLLDGQSDGVGRIASNGFGEACITSKQDIRDRIRYFPNPYSFNPKFADDSKHLDTLKEWRASLFRAAHVVIALDGAMGTEAELEVARRMDCRIIPAPSTEGVVSKLLSDPGICNNLSGDYIGKAKAGKLSVEDIISSVKMIFKL